MREKVILKFIDLKHIRVGVDHHPNLILNPVIAIHNTFNQYKVYILSSSIDKKKLY